MAIVFKFRHGRKERWDVVSFHELPVDMKRMLIVQIGELIHEIEDCEDDAASIGSVHAIRFLDDCYRAA